MKIGTKVKARYVDAVEQITVWDGKLIGECKDGRLLVDVGGIAIKFKPEEVFPYEEAREQVDQGGS